MERYGLIDYQGNINKPLVLALIRTGLEHKELRDIILREVARKHKQELIELLGIELKWDEDFERWLTERKSKPLSPQTLRDYRNLLDEADTVYPNYIRHVEEVFGDAARPA